MTDKQGKQLFGDLKDYLCEIGSPREKNLISGMKLRHCGYIETDRAYRPKDPLRARYFAHVGHTQGSVCYSKDLWKQSPQAIVGVLIHEIGHILSGIGEEPDADLAILGRFGIEIKYDDDMELQYVNQLVCDKIMKG